MPTLKLKARTRRSYKPLPRSAAEPEAQPWAERRAATWARVRRCGGAAVAPGPVGWWRTGPALRCWRCEVQPARLPRPQRRCVCQSVVRGGCAWSPQPCALCLAPRRAPLTRRLQGARLAARAQAPRGYGVVRVWARRGGVELMHELVHELMSDDSRSGPSASSSVAGRGAFMVRRVCGRPPPDAGARADLRGHCEAGRAVPWRRRASWPRRAN